MRHSYLVPGGAGLMGAEVARYLMSRKATKRVHIIDTEKDLIDDLERRLSEEGLNDTRLTTEVADATDLKYMRKKVEDSGVTFSCLPYFMNLPLTELVIDRGKIMCDLGGNPGVTNAQHALDAKARYHKSIIVVPCGIAPGASEAVAMDGVNRLGGPENVDYIRLYGGGLPVNPQGILQYKQLFYIEGWFNEIRGDCEVLENYELKTDQPPMTGIETIDFPGVGLLEGAHNSGGIGRLAHNLQGRVREVWYKTLRFPGHWQMMKNLLDLGFLEQKELACGVSPSKMSEELIAKHIRYESNDMMLLRCDIGSKPKDNKQKVITYYLAQLGDMEKGITSMEVATSDSMVIAGLLAEQGHTRYGVVSPGEQPPDKFLRYWSRRGMNWWREEKTFMELRK
ncbi:saccharopine dehydrogenase NADP-binding domain-containing protein [Candidatus Woesearchaeota archaeon]|nr:saccharopine dehydrogenase NADP-binding domain-containing protein [Candidatus Woesearchaeota archaeon]